LKTHGEIAIRQRVIRLKPALAYATARQRKQLQDFSNVVIKAIDMIRDNEDFNYFVEFIEGIVAYHRFHGGKD